MLQKQLTQIEVKNVLQLRGVNEMMFTRTFILFVIFACIVTVLAIVVFAVFCRYRANSFINTGRMTDVQTWRTRADISWITAVLFAIAISFFAYSSF